MSTLRVSNIEAKADASSPTIDEKVKITNSQGRVLMHVDGKTSGITTVGINTTGNTFTVSGNNVTFSGSVSSSGVSTFTTLNVGVGGTVITTTVGGNVGIGSVIPRVSLDASQETDAIALPQGTTAQRPTGTAPYIRYNTTNSALEFYNGTDWVEIISDYFPSGSTILG